MIAATVLGLRVQLGYFLFALGLLCLIVSLVGMIRMEERPLRGRSEEVPPVA